MLLLGVLGTGHCLGMCGPLVVAFPMRRRGVPGHVCYHAGRILTYAAVGAAMGGAGAGVTRLASGVGGDPLTWMVRIQVGVSLAAALFLLHFGLVRLGFLREPAWMSPAGAGAAGIGRLARPGGAGPGLAGLTLLGSAMGLLPCGLSFAAFARALASASPWAGGVMALVFGIGTLPGLLVLGTGAAGIVRRYRVQSDILAGLLMIAMAADLAADAMAAVA